MTKISIIVPVYNVEIYLERCLNSLVKQTLKDIEIIVVNDGSPDNSQKIIDKYAKKYNNLKAYTKKNGGLSSARNFGLKYANGEYIAFVDSDDYVERDMYEKMYNKAKQNNYDIVVCNLNYIYETKIVKAYSNISNELTNKDEIKKSMNYIYPSAWNKIFNRKLFDNDVRFKEKVWFEDVEFLYRLYPYIESIGVVNDHLYNYVQREGTITHTYNEKINDYISNWNGIIEFYKDRNLSEEYKQELEYSYVRYIYATFIKQALNFNDFDMFNKCVDNAILNVKKNFPKYRRNKYFFKSIKGIYCICFNKTLSKIMYLFYKMKERK